MSVEKLLPVAQKRLVLIADSASIIEAATLFIDRRTDLIVVQSSSKPLAGVITKTDIVSQISRCQGCDRSMTVSEVMAREVVLCHPGDPLRDVWSVMKARNLKNIPVVDGNLRPLGVLNARDALEMLRKEVEDVELLLGNYVMGVGYR